MHQHMKFGFSAGPTHSFQTTLVKVASCMGVDSCQDVIEKNVLRSAVNSSS
jgi:hypothetical protein